MGLADREQALLKAMQALLIESEALSLGFVSIKLSEAIDRFWFAKGLGPDDPKRENDKQP